MEILTVPHVGFQEVFRKTTKSDLQSNRTQDGIKYPGMADHAIRQKTFTHRSNDVFHDIPVLVLVTIGLFYSATTDKLVCYACGLEISSWKDLDELQQKHKKLSPHCHCLLQAEQLQRVVRNCAGMKDEMLKEVLNDEYMGGKPGLQCAGRDTNETSSVPVIVNDSATALNLIKGDINLGSGASIVEKRMVRQDISELPDYTIEANRLNSFNTWSAQYPVKPTDLAMAGLYFTGPNDRVQCAFCRGALYSWQDGDSALAEHKRHFPECSFIQNNFDNIMKRYLDSARASATDVPDAGNHSAQDSESLVKTKQIVHSLGYSMDAINAGVAHLQQKGESPTASTLIEVLFDDAPSLPRENPPTSDTGSSPELPTINNSTLIAKHNKELSSPTKPLNDLEIHTLKEQNKSLSDRVTCKICLCDNVRDVFLPCRHLVCCEACSKEVTKCPLCRTKIAATIKAFLS